MEVKTEHSTLFYRKEGSGAKNLLLFHGFGQHHTAFDAIRNDLTTGYTCYSFDLYFHGQSTWADEDVPVSKNEWKQCLNDFLQKQNIERFSMISFSIGTKFLLATLEAFPGKIQEIFLIAPDGITTSFWYRIATQYAFFRRIFKGITERPEIFFSFLKVGQHCGVIRKDVSVFVRHQLRSPEKREQVYKSWIAFRELHFRAQDAATVINQFDIPVHILIGKYDHIITQKKITPLLKHLRQYSLDIEEAGHHQLLTNEFLSKLLCQEAKW